MSLGFGLAWWLITKIVLYPNDISLATKRTNPLVCVSPAHLGCLEGKSTFHTVISICRTSAFWLGLQQSPEFTQSAVELQGLLTDSLLKG